MIFSFRNTVTLISVIVGLVLIFYLKTVVAYLIVSVVLALMGRPIMKWLDGPKIRGKSLPIVLKSGITLTLLLCLFFGLFYLFTPLVVDEIKIISSIDFESVLVELDDPINDLDNFLKKNHLLTTSSSLKNELSSLIKLTDIKIIFNSAIDILGNSIIALFSILFITFFFLKEKDIINNFVINITPKKILIKYKTH